MKNGKYFGVCPAVRSSWSLALGVTEEETGGGKKGVRKRDGEGREETERERERTAKNIYKK